MLALDENGSVIIDETDSFKSRTPEINAMEPLTTVEYTKYSFGVMILTIDGVGTGDHQYWALYEVGNYSQVGISEIIIDEDTSIE